ncbi:MAG TPA: dipeptidase [Candidatus Polarisedimenticolaceae bacterium]|nr:dipeptidase [Candidatus Polarisedimenticolaceae bacterium]
MSLILAASVSSVALADAALDHARTLLKTAILVDGHNDLPWAIHERKSAPMDLDAVDLTKPGPGDTDIPKLRAGGVGAQLFSVYVPGDLKDGRFARMQLEQIDLARRLIAKYPDDLALCTSAEDIVRAHAAGKIGSLLEMEGGHAIENSLGALRAYYDLGVRSMALVHNQTLAWADAAQDEPKHHGLTDFGREVVREMNRLGMIVDLAHASPETMRDALATTTSPVIFSHACAKALADHPRNVPDDVLTKLAANDGVVMIAFVPIFASGKIASWWAPVWPEVLLDPRISTLDRVKAEHEKVAGPEPKATLADVADQIEYVRKVAGVDHVGLGADFPPTAGAPEGLEDVSKYPALLAELIRRGWKDEDVVKVAGGNFLRVLRANEANAKKGGASLASLPADPPPFAGVWRGVSTCVKDDVHPACKDETVVYRIAAKDAVHASMDAFKIVDGKELLMGSIDFAYDAAKDAWVGDFQNETVHIRWSYRVRGDEMLGTLVDLPSNHLSRQAFAKRDR